MKRKTEEIYTWKQLLERVWLTASSVIGETTFTWLDWRSANIRGRLELCVNSTEESIIKTNFVVISLSTIYQRRWIETTDEFEKQLYYHLAIDNSRKKPYIHLSSKSSSQDTIDSIYSSIYKSISYKSTDSEGYLVFIVQLPLIIRIVISTFISA